jgi:hypothetical protein
VTSVDRTAYPCFGRVVSGRELAESFTPTGDEAEWARAATQDDRRLLALVVWLKSYQRLGYFPEGGRRSGGGDPARPGRAGLAGDVELEQPVERTGMYAVIWTGC